MGFNAQSHRLKPLFITGAHFLIPKSNRFLYKLMTVVHIIPILYPLENWRRKKFFLLTSYKPMCFPAIRSGSHFPSALVPSIPPAHSTVVGAFIVSSSPLWSRISSIMVVVVCSCNQGWDPSSVMAAAVPFKLHSSSGFWAFSEVQCPCSNGSVTENIFSSFLQGDLQFPLKHGHSSHCMSNHSGSIQCHDVLLIHERYWKKDVRKEGKRRNCQRHMCIWKEQGRKVETWGFAAVRILLCWQAVFRSANEMLMATTTPVYGHTHAAECLDGSDTASWTIILRVA